MELCGTNGWDVFGDDNLNKNKGQGKKEKPYPFAFINTHLGINQKMKIFYKPF